MVIPYPIGWRYLAERQLNVTSGPSRILGGMGAVPVTGELSTAVPRARKSLLEAVLRLVYVPAVVLFPLAIVLVGAFARPSFAWDFRALYQAGHDYLHLHSPYVSGGFSQLATRDNFVYPLPIAALFAPVSLVPYTIAAVLFVALSTVLLVLAVWTLGVRDWRCYAVLLLSVPAFSGIGLGTISPLLAFVLALLWRFRNQTRVVVPLLSFLVLAKVFLWPVGLWLLLTRRFRAVVAAVILCACLIFVSDAPVGFGALAHYPGLLKSLSAFEAPMSLSIVSFGTFVSGSSLAGTFLSLAAGLIVVVGMARAANRDDDVRVFCLSVVAALAMSPIVWNHYLLLLCVPLALTRPRFAVVWLASSWILGDGLFLNHTALTVLTVATWIAVVVQSGALERAGRVRIASPRLGASVSVAAAATLWMGLVWLVGELAASAPGAAALIPREAASGASGTALVRVIRQRNELCWRILTEGLPSSTYAEFFVGGRRTALIRWPMRGGQSDTCGRYAMGWNLSHAYQTGRIRLWLVVASPAGDGLLRGRIVYDMNDLLPSRRVR
jgi:hypothetical protein